MTAACDLGLGCTKAYELARHVEFPCRVIRIGDTYRVPTAGLPELPGQRRGTRHRGGGGPMTAIAILVAFLAGATAGSSILVLARGSYAEFAQQGSFCLTGS
jgi:hypothetical protein